MIEIGQEADGKLTNLALRQDIHNNTDWGVFGAYDDPQTPSSAGEGIPHTPSVLNAIFRYRSTFSSRNISEYEI